MNNKSDNLRNSTLNIVNNPGESPSIFGNYGSSPERGNQNFKVVVENIEIVGESHKPNLDDPATDDSRTPLLFVDVNLGGDA
jgi:hypothetical protein